jgi:hypothetical protein
MALLGEEEISLLGGRQIGDTVTGVEHGWALVSGEGSVGADGAALVVTEAAVKQLVLAFCSLDYNLGGVRGRGKLTSRHGRQSPIPSPH